MLLFKEVRSKILLESNEKITLAATKYIQIFKDIPHVFNLGYGLLPETDPDKVDMLIKFYRNFMDKDHPEVNLAKQAF